ncbi:CAP domain-containing protein [Nocardioides mangrovi]|uniref:CAP domain-containing protein n=1 Tax=Nocardioides mangrovi TaxID=2874580 RepID=A0ABS7U935_9ACTN|nr:CAP domain-containing protein [Nocardioides mangrovi]MBZ5737486.1 CAP domain-containing protein [Nocardioides mangrovi]
MSRTIRIAIALAPVALLVGLLSAAPASADSPSDRYEKQAFAATNQQRDRHDRRDLRSQRCVEGFAERWARHMARTEDMVHQSLGPIMRRCHLTMAGENIAYGFASGRSVVNQGWMHSEGHRENILRPQYRLMGMGARRDDDGRWWISQVFGRR